MNSTSDGESLDLIETRLVGLVYLVLSLVPLPFHVVVCLAIIRSKLHRSRPPYIILVTSSLSEIAQLLIHALTGICGLTGRRFCDGVHVVISNLMFFFFITMVFLQVLLCVNRFVTFVLSRFMTKNTVEMTYSLVSVCIIGGVFCTAGCSADPMRFRLESMSWIRDYRTSFSTAIYYLQIALIVLGLACCLFVVLFLADQKRKVTETRIPIKQTEVRIFIHSTIIFLIMASNLVLQHSLNFLLNNRLQSGIFVNVEWILLCGVPPFLAIWMNSEISRSIRELTMRDPVTKTNAVSVTA